MKRSDVCAFSAVFDPDPAHALHVETLALALFDDLGSLHGLGNAEREVLSSAALLHDIGWVGGGRGHHKRSCSMIMADRTLPFSEDERVLVALVARYHRRSLPGPKHPLYAGLSSETKAAVCSLSALLRIADGLDVGHAGAVAGLACTPGGDEVIVCLNARPPASEEMRAAGKKGDLFRLVYGKNPVFRVR
ncbi:MAG: exopolyphosphatase / guanosine-5-triphosphate,3-diphosphate pyrophosphatase [Methanofollis sp.]|nr:exopolyphosphatase / guanosine-5-triphosphate,3-diphosphate pyrophosphatase [Methanofollis sp.]